MKIKNEQLKNHSNSAVIEKNQEGIIELINLDGNVLYKSELKDETITEHLPKTLSGVFFYKLMCGGKLKGSGQLILD